MPISVVSVVTALMLGEEDSSTLQLHMQVLEGLNVFFTFVFTIEVRLSFLIMTQRIYTIYWGGEGYRFKCIHGIHNPNHNHKIASSIAS